MNLKAPGVYDETKRHSQKAWVEEESDSPDDDSGEVISKCSQTESVGANPQGGHNQCCKDVALAGNPS